MIVPLPHRNKQIPQRNNTLRAAVVYILLGLTLSIGLLAARPLQATGPEQPAMPTPTQPTANTVTPTAVSIQEACQDNFFTLKCFLTAVDRLGWWLAAGIALIIFLLSLAYEGMREAVKEAGKYVWAWIRLRLTSKNDPMRQYLNWFISTHHEPKFGALSLSQTVDDQFIKKQPAGLVDIYLPVDVNFELTEEERQNSDKEESTSNKKGDDIIFRTPNKEQKLDLITALKKSPVLSVTGEAGSGKSTLLQWLGLVCAHQLLGRKVRDQKELIKALGGPLFPIFVSLGAFDRDCLENQREKSATTLLDFIAVRYKSICEPRMAKHPLQIPPDFFANQIKKGCLLLLDGVDEVSPKERGAVRLAVNELIQNRSKRTRILITSRPSAAGEAQVTDSRQGFIQALEPEQRNQLIHNLYDYYDRVHSQQRSQDLIQRLDASDERVQKMAKTPLLTTIFVLIHRPGHELPNQRAEVYEQAIDVLMKEPYRQVDLRLRQDKGKEKDTYNQANSEDDPTEKRTRLGLIAFKLLEKGIGEDRLPENDLIDLVLPEIRTISSELEAKKEEIRKFLYGIAYRGGMIDEQDCSFAFRQHRSFQEYLAGWHLVKNYAPYDLDRQGEFIRQHLENDQWEEPIRLAAGYLAIGGKGEANAFIRNVMGLGSSDRSRDFAIALAGLCLADLPAQRVFPELREELASEMLKVVKHEQPVLPIRLRAHLGYAIGSLQDPAIKNRLFDTRLHPGGLPELVTIPAGPFRMGTNQGEPALKKQQVIIFKDESPEHSVTISYDFQVGKYPVTNAEYRTFLLAEGYDLLKWGDCWSAEGKSWLDGSWEPDVSIYSESSRESMRNWLAQRPIEKRRQPLYWDDLRWNGSNQPVVGVTWFEAEAYCNWLTRVLQASGDLSTELHFRLPTEAEWEKTARFSPAPSETRFFWPWGDVWDAELCNNDEPKDSLKRTSPVGIFPGGANCLGVMDLVGNTWEWCRDFWDENEYEKRIQTGQPILDPTGPASGQARVVRGGSWCLNRLNARSSSRSRLVPDLFYGTVGFRLVLSPIRF